jgi:hypothetical protein
MVNAQKSANRMRAVNERGHFIGEGHPGAVLTDHEVDLVLELRAELDADGKPRYSLAWLAAKFEVSKSCMAKICRGEHRAQIPAGFRRTREPSGRR